MGEVKVLYGACDLSGCENQWPLRAPANGGLEVTFGVHPEIVRNLGKPAIVQKRIMRFCPNHAEKIKWPLITVVKFLGGIEESEFMEKLGCWVTVWHYHGGFIQQDLNHQLPYEVFELNDYRLQGGRLTS
jgi:hypothetical protein